MTRARRPQAAQLSLKDLLSPIGLRAEIEFSCTRSWPALKLPPGRWTPPLNLRREDVTLLVVSGALFRRCPNGTDVLLAGDLSRVGSTGVDCWRVLSDWSVLAVLTPAGVEALAGVPGAAHALLQAVHAQHERSLQLRSIAAGYDVRQRIVRFFQYLARRLGRSEGGAVRIALRLDQKRIEEIVGAGHTQGTASFRALINAGVLVRDADGWLLCDAGEAARTYGLSSSSPNSVVTDTSSPPNSLTPALPETLALSLIHS